MLSFHSPLGVYASDGSIQVGFGSLRHDTLCDIDATSQIERRPKHQRYAIKGGTGGRLAVLELSSHVGGQLGAVASVIA